MYTQRALRVAPQDFESLLPITPSMSQSDASVYTTHISNLRYGLPIYFPRPTETAGEVQLGDVGVYDKREGRFTRLLNIFTGPIGLARISKWSPYEELEDQPPVALDSEQHFQPGVYSDMGLSRASATSQSNGTQSWTFDTSKSSGALLVLPNDSRNLKRIMRRTSAITQLVRAHYWEWLDLAHRSGHECGHTAIILVTDFVKTTKWSLITFQCEPSQDRRRRDLRTLFQTATPHNPLHGRITLGNTTALSDPQIVFTGRDWDSPPPYNVRQQVHSSTEGDSEQCNQCLFLGGLRVRFISRRLFMMKMVAAAGTHNLPDDSDDDDEGPTVFFKGRATSRAGDTSNPQRSNQGGDDGHRMVSAHFTMMSKSARAAAVGRGVINTTRVGSEEDQLHNFLTQHSARATSIRDAETMTRDIKRSDDSNVSMLERPVSQEHKDLHACMWYAGNVFSKIYVIADVWAKILNTAAEKLDTGDTRAGVATAVKYGAKFEEYSDDDPRLVKIGNNAATLFVQPKHSPSSPPLEIHLGPPLAPVRPRQATPILADKITSSGWFITTFQPDLSGSIQTPEAKSARALRK